MQQLFLRPALISFPPAKGGRVNAKAVGKFFLSEAKKFALDNYLLPKGVCLDTIRGITEELDDCWYIMQLWE